MMDRSSLLWMLGLSTFSALLTLALVPCIRKFAAGNGLLDLPAHRKKHHAATAACGGIAIFVGLFPIFLGLVALAVLREVPLSVTHLPKLVSLFCACAWILFLGVMDDKKGLKWTAKLAGQGLGVLILVLGGHSVAAATVPFFGLVTFGWLGILFFGILLIVITNAINLIDGLDGLAAGICLFAGLAGGLTAFLKGDLLVSILQFTLVGTLIGFLPYNWPPARVFLGDGGSMMLGFFLGTIAISTATVSFPGQRPAMFAALVAPFLPFSIAFLDIGLAVLRRWIRGRKIYLPDTDHLHHRLAAEFRSAARVNLVVYSFSGTFAALSVLLAVSPEMSESLWIPSLIAILVTGLAVLLLRVYRVNPIGHIPRVMAERTHFKFLDLYCTFMAARLARAKSVSECVALLESGVRDLCFDSVQIFQGDTCVGRWDNTDRAHPQSTRSIVTKGLKSVGLSVSFIVPHHERKSYQESLQAAWLEFLNNFEVRVRELTPGSDLAHELHTVHQQPLPDPVLPGGIVTVGRR